MHQGFGNKTRGLTDVQGSIKILSFLFYNLTPRSKFVFLVSSYAVLDFEHKIFGSEYCLSNVGTVLIKSTCVRNDDESMVSDHFCGGERPRDETVICNTHECPARWVLKSTKRIYTSDYIVFYFQLLLKLVGKATYCGGYF